MSEIRLNGKQYELAPKSRIIKRAINPFKGKLGVSGGLEYSDFSNASLEEYHDFRNGIGKNRAVGSDARLEFSQGIDFSIEGQTVLGPLVTTAGSINALSAPSITNAGFESTPPTGWTTDSGSWTRSGTEQQAGSYSWRNGSVGAGEFIYQDVSYISGAEYTFTVYIKCNSAADTMKVGIDDGVDAVEYGTAVGNTGWTQITVTKTLSNSATQCRLMIEVAVAGAAGPVFVDTAAISVTAADTFAAVKILDFQSSTYAIGGNSIIKWNNTTWDIKAILTSPIDMIVVTDGTDEYLVVSSATAGIYSVDGTTWLILTGCQGYLAWYDAKLRGIDTDGNTLRSSALNNIDGSWTTFSLTGDFGTVFDLFEGKLLSDGTPVLYFTGTKGAFTIDVTNEIAYPVEIAYPPLTFAGHKGMYWNANVWVATGYGIIKVASGTAAFVGPDQDDGLPAGYQGYIYDMTTVNNWLVFCVNGGSTDKSSILKRNSSLGGNLQVYTTSAINKPIACVHHSPSSMYTNGRLWFGEDTSIKYMMFPDTTSNVKQIATYQYVDDSGFGTFPIFRKMAIIDKVALSVSAVTKSLNANEKIEVFYGLNGAAATTSLGTFTSSPRPARLEFNSGLGTAFYTIQFAIKLYRGSTNTNSPELESLVLSYYGTPATINGWIFRIMATEDNAEEKIAEFEAIRDTKTLVVFNPTGDPGKTSFNYNVKLVTMPLDFVVENQQTRQGFIQIDCQQVFEG